MWWKVTALHKSVQLQQQLPPLPHNTNTRVRRSCLVGRTLSPSGTPSWPRVGRGVSALEPGRHARSCSRSGSHSRSGSRSRSLSLSREVRRLRRTAAKSRSARARDDQDRKQELNVAFDDLRRLLPVTLSKLEILIHAMGYIFCLNDVLNDEQPLTPYLATNPKDSILSC
ncbi:hypothetical protein CRUP_033685 [Coryphaenoides rupestris]|nr:hypothetical protein CRUP_033685 [Coryphaenoides rupestris]